MGYRFIIIFSVVMLFSSCKSNDTIINQKFYHYYTGGYLKLNLKKGGKYIANVKGTFSTFQDFGVYNKKDSVLILSSNNQTITSNDTFFLFKNEVVDILNNGCLILRKNDTLYSKKYLKKHHVRVYPPKF